MTYDELIDQWLLMFPVLKGKPIILNGDISSYDTYYYKASNISIDGIVVPGTEK